MYFIDSELIDGEKLNLSFGLNLIDKFNLILFPTSGLLILYAIDLPIKFLEKIEIFSDGVYLKAIKLVAKFLNSSPLYSSYML